MNVAELRKAQIRTTEIILLAVDHVDQARMKTSAELCLSHAFEMEIYDPEAARMWARKSLAYSVGKLHPDYLRAAK